jgi:hypothetical protein
LPVRSKSTQRIKLAHYPAKREVSFKLDNTYYVALVKIIGNEAKMTPAR